MAQLKVENVEKDLKQEGFTSDQVKAVKDAIEANTTSEPQNKAVIFLGWATLALVVGGILLAYIGKTVPDPLWTVLGTGFGGLAGIFMGKK